MNISSGQKMAVLGVLLVGAAAAFVYLDPLDLDLLGLKPAPVAAPVVKPRPAAPKPTTPVAPPVNPAATAAPAIPEKSGVVGAIPETPTTAAESKFQFVPVLSKPKPITKPVSLPSVDLRHCLEETTNEAIAKCAGE